MPIKRLHNILLLCIIVVNACVIGLPFLPALNYAVASHGSEPVRLQAKLHRPDGVAPAPEPNNVVIPSMLLDQPILDGTDIYDVLNHGILRWSASSTPDAGGNTVLLGHRFTYHIPKGVLYYLDKVQVGDEISVVWKNKQYLYKVNQVKVVPPTDTSIEAPTADARLTIFTCTPLLWPKERLVVVAGLEQS